MMGYYDFGYGMGFSWIFMALFWVVIIWFVIWFLKNNKQLMNFSSEKTANEILKARYARGEISKKEYAEMKKELSRD